MLSMSGSGPTSAIFIRECYITWFTQFLAAAENDPCGKFALSSSPGCGKTSAANFIFKMAHSTPSLRKKPILYQFKDAFFYLTSDKVFDVDRPTAYQFARDSNTFYILDGPDADPVTSMCLTLFISSPRSERFKDWHYHAQITPSYFPVWSLDELHSCRELCYPQITVETVDDRYRKYGGIARYVFWTGRDPPSIEAVLEDSNARKSIRAIGEPSQIFPSSHMLLHLFVDEELQFKHVVLASRYVGVLLFSKYFAETLQNLNESLGGGGALGGHLFECYVHYLFQFGREQPLICRSLEGLHRPVVYFVFHSN
jgi:hypothetical protein